MIAADHAVRRLPMTLLEQIKLWVINLDTESMHANGFIRVLLTSEAFVCRKATYVNSPPAFEMVHYEMSLLTPCPINQG